ETCTPLPIVALPTYQSCVNDPVLVLPSGEPGFEGWGFMLPRVVPETATPYWSLKTALPRLTSLPLVRASKPSFHSEDTPFSSVAAEKSSFTSMNGIGAAKLSKTRSEVHDLKPFDPLARWSVPSSSR